MPDHTTPRRGFPYPDSTGLVGGPTGVGAVDTKELAESMDSLDQGFASMVSTGLGTVTEWNFGPFEIVAGTGELKSQKAAGGVAWLPDATLSGAMARTVTPATRLEIKPASLPAEGKFKAILFEFKPPTLWGGPVTYVLTPLADKTTQSAAELSVPAKPEGTNNLLYSWCVVKNTGGVFSIVSQGSTLPEEHETGGEGAFTIKGGSWVLLAGPAAAPGPVASTNAIVSPGTWSIASPSGESPLAEPHPLRPVLVTLRLWEAGGFEFSAKLKLRDPYAPNNLYTIGEATMHNTSGKGRQRKVFSFVCPAGVSWKVAISGISGASNANTKASYVVL